MMRSVLAVATCAVLLAGCGSAAGSPGGTDGSPGGTDGSRRSVQVARPTATATDRCTQELRSGGGHQLAVTVDPAPTTVLAAWYPGLNRARCHEPVTRGGAPLARHLAHDIRIAQRWPAGPYACPADFGRSAQLYFGFPHEARVETVTVTLTGCVSILAAGRGATLEPGRLISDLRPLAPAALRPLLGV